MVEIVIFAVFFGYIATAMIYLVITHKEGSDDKGRSR